MIGARLPGTFICLWCTWILLTASLDPHEVAVGAIASLIISTFSYRFLFRKGVAGILHPGRLAYLIAYIFVYLWAEIKSHLKVIYLALHPRTPIKPGIVEVPTSLRTDVGTTWLANSITMTPGTLSVDADENGGKLYVHWIDVKSTEPARAASEISGQFERFLRRIAG
ncbi:MAG: Na+/H+ antiporter subunit E [Candidatus Hadarchaeales archaeon]